MATEPAFRFVFLNHPNDSQLNDALEDFERNLANGKIHTTARLGLSGKDELGFNEPFPKIESHDSYIYGVLATPTDIDDGRSEFFNIQFVMHEQMSLVILYGPDAQAQNRSKELFARISRSPVAITEVNDGVSQEPGDIFVQVAQVIVQDLQMLITRLHRAANEETTRIESQLFDDEYQSMSRSTSETYRRIRLLKFEIISIAPTIDETQNVFKAIYDRKVLIRPPFRIEERDTSPFSTDQRIWIDDLLMRTRSLKAQRNGLEQEVRLLYERLESLENRRQTASQMRFAAVASILLLPALIVGFFGQNFEINPWVNSELSWEISAVALAAIAVSQFIYFKRKKWF
jgi:Mg2+ and Co2+ transporter CorA